MRISYPFCLLLLFTSSLMGQNNATKTHEQLRVDSIFRSFDNQTSPGCAMAVVRNGAFIYMRGYGMANLENNIPITGATVFDIGSTSKQFTAACLVLLSQQGRLSLDDNVRKHLPELPDYGKTITLRHLLQHTSGLRDYPTLMETAGFTLEQVTTTKDALDIIIRQKSLNFNPGDDWLYTNTGFFLASVIIERVSGKTLQQFAKENIFDPLGMTHTLFLDNHAKNVPGRATGYSPGTNEDFTINMSNWEQTGDGAVQTSLEDLLKWDANFYQPSVGGKAMIDALTTPGKLNNGENTHYGLGLFNDPYKGLDRISHGGAWAGYRAEVLRFPKEKYSVFCLCNLATANPSGLALRVADIYLEKEIRGVKYPASIASPSFKITPADLSGISGHYRRASDETMREISVREGKVFYIRGRENESELIPTGKNNFRMKGVPADIQISFTLNDQKKVLEMKVVTNNGKPDIFESYQPIKLPKEQTGEFTGIYYSDELDVDYTIIVQGSGLVLMLKRVGSFPLTPTIQDSFSVENVGGVKFKRDGQGRIEGFSLSQGRAKGMVFQRRKGF